MLDKWLLIRCREHSVASVSPRAIQQYGPGSLRDKSRRDNAIEELIVARRVRLTKKGDRHYIEINPALVEGEGHGAA